MGVYITMARQIPSSDMAQEALKNHDSYYAWLCKESGISGPLAQMFFETDFRWTEDVLDDENRAKDGVALREQYAIYLLACDKDTVTEQQWHNIDRLKKSILGPASVFEVLVCLARDLDEMLNMDPERQVQTYFERLMMNVGFDFYDEEDYDMDPKKVTEYWHGLMDRMLDRTYLPDGEGGLFPLDLTENLTIDMRKIPLWEQLNTWVGQEMTINPW